MDVVLFYEKPGCSSNAKQKRALRDAGCMVIVRDLLQNNLTLEELLAYLEDSKIEQWFNPNAPKIKDGSVNPKNMTKMSALELLLFEPILIRRPLMVVKNKKMCGFDQDAVEKLLGRRLNMAVSEQCSSTTDTCENG